MKKILLLAIVFILIPFGGVRAITQNQTDAEVQILCPDSYGNWYSGSGTIIDPKGIILTNKHVVSDKYGQIINTCAIGFIKSINQDPNFYTDNNINIAEVKYYTTSDDMDTAILYLKNPSNKVYPYINIWDSKSSSLSFGDKIEVIGFPGIGGSTITYTSGDFSGFGSNSYNTQNYIKATAVLEHGNSGGAAYNSSGQFMGIPTMVIAGTLNSLGYILSVDSIKTWLSSKLGNSYKQEVIKHVPVIPATITENELYKFEEDITPPNFNVLSQMCMSYFDDSHSQTGAGCFPANMGKISDYNHIRFTISRDDINKIDPSGLKKIYYYFDTVPHTQLDSNAVEHTITEYLGSKNISDIIDIDKEGKYYFSFFGEDNRGNLSSANVYEYIYEKETFKTVNSLSFYKDNSLNSFIKGYKINFNEMSDYTYAQESLECSTRLNSLTVTWKYPRDYKEYVAQHFNSWRPLAVISIEGNVVDENRYTLSGLNKGNKFTWSTNNHQPDGYQDGLVNRYYEFYLKPVISGYDIEEKHRLIKLAYDPYLKEDVVCKRNYIYTETDEKVPLKTQSQEEAQVENNKEISDIAKRLRGRILLQVENHGEAWYVNPKDNMGYYMANGEEAYRIMRYLGVGITNNDLDKVMADKSFAKKHSGKIFLQVEAHGEAYYIDVDGNAHYLKNGSAAYTAMRDLGLGITNNDLDKIETGEL
jgi:hypothetical protein